MTPLGCFLPISRKGKACPRDRLIVTERQARFGLSHHTFFSLGETVALWSNESIIGGEGGKASWGEQKNLEGSKQQGPWSDWGFSEPLALC